MESIERQEIFMVPSALLLSASLRPPRRIIVRFFAQHMRRTLPGFCPILRISEIIDKDHGVGSSWSFIKIKMPDHLHFLTI
jgi:hypothetical protein